MMKEFEKMFNRYSNHEDIYLEMFARVNFNDWYDECDKNLEKYNEFKGFLKYSEECYNNELVF